VKISSFECEGLEPKLLDRRSWWICRCWFNQSPQKKILQKEKLKGDLEFYGTGCASFTHVQFFQLSWSTPKVFEFWSGPSAERGVKKDRFWRLSLPVSLTRSQTQDFCFFRKKTWWSVVWPETIGQDQESLEPSDPWTFVNRSKITSWTGHSFLRKRRDQFVFLRLFLLILDYYWKSSPGQKKRERGGIRDKGKGKTFLWISELGGTVPT